MTARPIYLDHNATTPVLPEVVEALLPFLTSEFGNPSSSHEYGRRAKQAVETARAQVAALINAPMDSIVFTSGGTEATALALRGSFLASTARRHLVTSTVEHPATSKLCDRLAAEGATVTRVGVDAHGLLKLDDVERSLTPQTLWLSVIHAHNETGVLQPLGELARRAHHAGALLHADGSQSAGKVPLDPGIDGFDLLTLAGHKLYAPKGVGALFVRPGVALRPTQVGAGHEGGLRAGTENVASIVGLGAACVAAKRDLDELTRRLTAQRDELIARLHAAIPQLVVAGERARRLPNTVYAVFPGVSGTALLARTPEVAASTGSACHDGHESAASVLLEMGFTPGVALGAVRLTLGRSTTNQDVWRAAAALVRAWRELTAK